MLALTKIRHYRFYDKSTHGDCVSVKYKTVLKERYCFISVYEITIPISLVSKNDDVTSAKPDNFQKRWRTKLSVRLTGKTSLSLFHVLN